MTTTFLHTWACKQPRVFARRLISVAAAVAIGFAAAAVASALG